MSTQTLAAHHPAPHRGRIGLLGAAFGVLAAPAAWATHLLVSYSLSSFACFPNGEAAQAPIWPALRTLLWGIDVVAIAIGITAGLVAWRNWQRTQHEARGSAHTLIDAGEGRTRFVALCGMLASGGFLLALAFASIGLIVVPACAG